MWSRIFVTTVLSLVESALRWQVGRAEVPEPPLSIFRGRLKNLPPGMSHWSTARLKEAGRRVPAGTGLLLDATRPSEARRISLKTNRSGLDRFVTRSKGSNVRHEGNTEKADPRRPTPSSHGCPTAVNQRLGPWISFSDQLANGDAAFQSVKHC